MAIAEKKSTGQQGEAKDLKRVTQLLGGSKALGVRLKTRMDAHEVILRGLPALTLVNLVDCFHVLTWTPTVAKALGMSERTFQRRREASAARLSQEQSGRTWQFAEILAKATEVFGSQREAERWLERPAIGLDRRRPIELLATPAGVELVEDHLTRLEYGVYS